jgi:hypothetical protein
MDLDFKKVFKKFKYFGVFVDAYTNEKDEIKKHIIAPYHTKYENSKHYFQSIYHFKSGKNYEPNGIAINTSEISTIDVDEPDNCKKLVEKLLIDCKFYIKTRKGYHFYFKKENVLSRNEKCDIVDINLPQLFYIPKYYHNETNEEFNYTLVKSDELVDMPQYAIDYCENIIEIHNANKAKKKNNKKNKLNNTEKIIIDKSLIIEKFNIETMKNIYSIFYDAHLFDTYEGWRDIGYMSRHLNNTEESYDLFDKFCRKVKGYENTPVNNNLNCFYGNGSYNENFDTNGVLIKCCKLNPIKYKKTLDNLYKSKYEEEIIQFNSEFIFTNENKHIFDDWHKNFKCLCLKSPYGTGKTYAFKQVIEIYKPKRILFITYRQSLANSLSEDLKQKYGFVNYLEEDIKKSDRVILQLDSIKKLNENINIMTQKDGIPSYDLIVLDESEGLLNHLSFEKIEQHLIHNILINLIKKSKKCLVLDGDMNERTYDFITTLEDITYKLYVNEFKGIQKNFIFSYDTKNYDEMIDNDLKNNKKIVIVCMTKSDALTYADKYKDLYKINLHISTDKNKNVLKNVNENWGSCDLLIYSPSVESGVDFNIKNYFHKCYATISNHSTSYRAFFQMLNRVRYYKDNNINVLIPSSVDWKIDDILCKFDEMKLNKWLNIEINNLTTILIHNDVERYNSKKYLITCLINTLLSKGHTYTYLDDKKKAYNNSEETLFKIKQDIINAKDITTELYEQLLQIQQKNIELTKEQNNSISKKRYKKVFNTNEINMEFLDIHYNKFHVLANYKLITTPKEERTDFKKYEYFKHFNNEKIEIVNELINTIGYDINLNKIKDVKYNEIKDTLIEKLNNKKFKQLFELEKEVKNNNILSITNDLFINYGFEVYKKRLTTTKNKIKTNDYILNVEHNDIIKQYLNSTNPIKYEELKDIDFI